ncbi:MAG: hypothetical protein MUC67_11290 [Acidobacteria bacterium]|jgi:hypothetical protein|nr:hypothetical protein [Acidobacteriota bacterium]
MADTVTGKTSLDRLLRATIHEILERNAEKFAVSQSLESDVRELRAAVARLERRLATLGRGGGARRAPRPGEGKPGRPPLYTHCTVADCGLEHYALGLCSKHYQQRRRGKVTRAMRAMRATKRRRPAGRAR